jgi:hypothetical protein
MYRPVPRPLMVAFPTRAYFAPGAGFVTLQSYAEQLARTKLLPDAADKGGAEDCRCRNAYQDDRGKNGGTKQQSILLDICKGDQYDHNCGCYVAQREWGKKQRGSQQQDDDADKALGRLKGG